MGALVVEPQVVGSIHELADVFDLYCVLDRDPADPARWDVFVCPCNSWQLQTNLNCHWASPLIPETWTGHHTRRPA